MENAVDNIMDSINHSNIDNMIYFYSFLLEKIVDRKRKIDRDLELFIEQGEFIQNYKSEIEPSLRNSDSDSDPDLVKAS